MHARGRGFTLIELIVASSITAMVTAATVLMLGNMAAGRERVDREARLHEQARAGMRAVVGALRNAHRATDRQDWLLEGVGDAPTGQAPQDRVRFYTVTHRRLRPEHPESDVHEVEFYLQPVEGEQLLVLHRRTDPARNDPPDGGGVVEQIARQVISFELLYFDGVEWHPQWEAQQQGWPLAVQATLVFAAEVGSPPRRFTRIVNFPHRASEGVPGGSGTGAGGE
ncbi:MAG: prepilin-type N-terminal cleavage/methylation domain-containing protein [Phycisphaeraceae bacterium]